ncbi:uncharacterized protein LOC144121903 [Amblyomma americanum]
MRERRKIKARSGASPDELYQPKWAHYKSLMFLDTSCSSQPSFSTLHTQEEEEETERQCEHWNNESADQEMDFPCSPQNCAEPSLPAQQIGEGTSRPGKKRRRNDDETEQRKVLLTTAVETLQRSQQRLAANDECDAFGSMMAHAVRQIPPGPDRQLAMLNAHQAIVKINLFRHSVPVEMLNVLNMQE